MRALLTTGWGLCVLYTVVVVLLTVFRDVGDDAAGRGMALGFAIVLGAALGCVAALLWWGQQRESLLLVAMAVILLSIPILTGVGILLDNVVTEWRYSRQG